MSASTTPPVTRILMAQLRLLWRRQGNGAAICLGILLLQVILIASFGTILGISISIDSEEGENARIAVAFANVDDFSKEADPGLEKGTYALVAAFAASCLLGVIWGLSNWSAEAPSRRDYHWSLPVEHGAHDLCRVAAGGLLLIGVEIVLYLAATSVALLFGNFESFGPLDSLCLLAGPLLPYLLTSAFALELERPLVWLLGAFGGLGLSWTLANAAGLAPLAWFTGGLFVSRYGFLQATAGQLGDLVGLEVGPTGSRWLLSWLLWAAILLTLTALAAAIPRVQRRRATLNS